MCDIYDQFEIDIEFESSETPVEIKNPLPYTGAPSNSCCSLDGFQIDIVDDYQRCWDEYYDESQKREEPTPNQLRTKLAELIALDVNIKHVYTHINYPLSRPANFKFTLKEGVPVTYGVLLYLYTWAYQKVYKLEDQSTADPGCIPGMLNRAQSNGTYGIWGHYIGDLVYNGHATLKIYPQSESVTCYFSCDS